MPAYSGSALYADWITTAATAVFSTDFRRVSYAPAIDIIDETAGADANRLKIASIKDGRVDIEYVGQGDGTAMTNAFAEGTSGTVTIAPEGTASGKEKITVPGIAMGAQRDQPYADVVSIRVSIEQNGARTDGNY